MTLRAEKLDKLMLEHEIKMDEVLKEEDEMLQLIHINDLEIQKLEAVDKFERDERE